MLRLNCVRVYLLTKNTPVITILIKLTEVKVAREEAP